MHERMPYGAHRVVPVVSREEARLGDVIRGCGASGAAFPGQSDRTLALHGWAHYWVALGLASL